ncbi:MAG: helix-turn-helix domain-containing protein [Phycisphaerales bacterium]
MDEIRNATGGQTAMHPLLTYREAAKVLGVTPRTVWTLVQAGTLPAVRFGRSVRIDQADLRRFIERAKSATQGVGHG